MKPATVLSAVALLGAAIAASIAAPSPLWTYMWRVGAVALGVALLCRWIAGAIRPLAVSWPEHPESGDFAGIDIVWRSPVPGFWEIAATAPEASLHASGWYGWGRHRLRLEHPSVRRGVHRYSVRFSYRDPFGLFRRVLPWQGEVELAVRPRTVPMPTLSVLRGARGAMVGQRRAERSDAPTGVRRYLPGDRLSEVHWPQTMRTGSTQVRDAYTRGAMLRTVALDTRAGAYQDEGTFELAVSVAASLVLSLARRGEAVSLVAGDHVVPARSATAARLMDVLTRISLGDGPDSVGGAAHDLIYIGSAQGAVAIRAQRPLVYAIAVGRDAQGEDLAIRDWPALHALARGVRAAR